MIDQATFGLGLYKVRQTPANVLTGLVGTQFTALKAQGSQVTFVGVGDFIKFSLEDVNVGINQSSKATHVIDFTDGGRVPGRDIATGGAGTNPIRLDFTNTLIEASVGHATAKVAGLVSLEGGFAFQKRTLDRIGFNVPGLEVVAAADALVIAGMDVSAFVGINGPYRTDTNDDGVVDQNDPINDDAIGFAIDDLDFALALLSPAATTGFSIPGLKFFALKATADLAGLVGTDPFMTLEGRDIGLSLNGAFAQGYPVPGFFADFTKLAGGGWHIPIGSTGREMVLDFDSNIFGVRVEAKLGIFDLFDISHDFDFTFELPGISLDSLSLDLPTFEMPDLSG